MFEQISDGHAVGGHFESADESGDIGVVEVALLLEWNLDDALDGDVVEAALGLLVGVEHLHGIPEAVQTMWPMDDDLHALSGLFHYQLFGHHFLLRDRCLFLKKIYQELYECQDELIRPNKRCV